MKFLCSMSFVAGIIFTAKFDIRLGGAAVCFLLAFSLYSILVEEERNGRGK